MVSKAVNVSLSVLLGMLSLLFQHFLLLPFSVAVGVRLGGICLFTMVECTKYQRLATTEISSQRSSLWIYWVWFISLEVTSLLPQGNLSKPSHSTSQQSPGLAGSSGTPQCWCSDSWGLVSRWEHDQPLFEATDMFLDLDLKYLKHPDNLLAEQTLTCANVSYDHWWSELLWAIWRWTPWWMRSQHSRKLEYGLTKELFRDLFSCFVS